MNGRPNQVYEPTFRPNREIRSINIGHFLQQIALVCAEITDGIRNDLQSWPEPPCIKTDLIRSNP